jgi:adenylate cyclase
MPGAELERRMRRRLSRATALANLLGALSVFGFLAFLLPFDVEDANRLILRSAIALGVYLGASLTLGVVLGRRRMARELTWLRESRAPTEAERRYVLGVPRDSALISASFWAVGAVIAPLVNIEIGGLAAVLAGAVVLGGVMTAAVGYLLSERIMRPVTAIALADAPPSKPTTPGVSARLMMAWTVATGVPVLGIVALTITALSGVTASETLVAASALFLAAVAILVGLPAVFLATRSVAEPLGALRQALGRVEAGDLEARVEVDDGSEIGLVEAGFNRMAEGLAEREHLRDLFGRHVGEEVARRALDEGVALGGEEREIAALFVDLVGSTALAARRPGEVVGLLTRSSPSSSRSSTPTTVS